jgi:hypothetical protein
MLYLISRKPNSKYDKYFRKLKANEYTYSVVKVQDKNLTVSEIYNEDNYVYRDDRNFILYNGFTLSFSDEAYPLVLKAVDDYKINKRLKKLNKI